MVGEILSINVDRSIGPVDTATPSSVICAPAGIPTMLTVTIDSLPSTSLPKFLMNRLQNQDLTYSAFRL